jgi:hypothetical protein
VEPRKERKKVKITLTNGCGLRQAEENHVNPSSGRYSNHVPSEYNLYRCYYHFGAERRMSDKEMGRTYLMMSFVTLNVHLL